VVGRAEVIAEGLPGEGMTHRATKRFGDEAGGVVEPACCAAQIVACREIQQLVHDDCDSVRDCGASRAPPDNCRSRGRLRRWMGFSRTERTAL
jgi:hypothetical protein